jgi:tRNA G18 (ribose-2'-O)-methylase SpoU
MAAREPRDGPVILYGWHPVKAALENPARRILRLFATEFASQGAFALFDIVATRPEIWVGRNNSGLQPIAPGASR